MNKNILIVLNSPYLGGAERSIIHQSSIIESNHNVTFFIPYLYSLQEETLDISTHIKNHSRGNIKYFNYPPTLYKLSRSSKLMAFVLPLFFLPKIFITLKKNHITKYQIVWANGNKVGVILYLWCMINSYSGKFIWHFRDYPKTTGIYKLLWKIFNFQHAFSLTIIGNSYSVSRAIKQITSPICQIKTLYNPVGIYLPNVKPNRTKKTLGIIAMMAPWKGLHNILVWTSLFEKELIDIEIDSILIFGDDIYKTEGEHNNYALQLKQLLIKFPSKLIKFKGIVPPDEIYPQIDILIHPTINMEPFGRVIIEAFSSGTPVISTAKGGALELIDNNISGLIYDPFDNHGLFLAVKSLVTNAETYNRIQRGAKEKLKIIETCFYQQLEQIINNEK